MSEHDLADLDSHHIEGYAAAAMEQGVDSRFSVPLISEILPGQLWTGGCVGGVTLPSFFTHVISLYPWEKYRLSDEQTRWEYRLLDSSDEQPLSIIEEASTVAAFLLRQDGVKLLIHCQAGLNRSGLIAALALRRLGYSSAEAIALLREKRCEMVLCNAMFETYLTSLDADTLAHTQT